MPPQPIPVPSPANNVNTNNVTPSQPMSINARVSPQDIYNRNRDAAQSAPISIPHKRDRSYSDIPQQSRPINMPGPSPGPRMPFIAEQSGPLKSPQFPSDFGVEATPPFSTNYLSTSSGAEGLNRFSNVSSTPPFKMASPPSSIFKPFKARVAQLIVSSVLICVCSAESTLLLEYEEFLGEVHALSDQHLAIPRLAPVSFAEQSSTAGLESWHDHTESTYWTCAQSFQSHLLRW